MKIYDTLLLGSGYYSVGYAEARGNSLIVEEGQVVDTSFYLPMRGFSAEWIQPTTAGGERLYACIKNMGLIDQRGLCVNGLESALARHCLDIGAPLRLKCRAVRRRTEGELTAVTLQSNEGLCEVYAREVVDTRPHGAVWYQNFLVTADSYQEIVAPIRTAFPGAEIDFAFYRGRCVITIPAAGYDENSIKRMIHARFPRVEGLKLLYIAPAFMAGRGGCIGQPGDAGCYGPVEAYDAGYRAGEVAK